MNKIKAFIKRIFRTNVQAKTMVQPFSEERKAIQRKSETMYIFYDITRHSQIFN